MTLVLSRQTVEHNDLLGGFLRALNEAQQSVVKLAEAYKACVDAGMDMSRFGKALCFRLQAIAEGKLLPEAHPKLLGNDAMVATMASLSIATQKEVMKQGVEVWRDEAAVVVPFDEVRPMEAKRLIDATAGKARLLSAEEQRERLLPPKPRHDKMLELRLKPKDYDQLQREAHKKHQSVAHFIIEQLALAGVLTK